MPTYRFQCECGLNFTAHRPVDTTTTKCECGATAARDLPQGVSVTVSAGNANFHTDTVGISKVDYNFDREVGESSRKNWRGIAGRQRDKIDVVQANGATGFDLSRNLDGTYRVMAPEERSASERSRGFHLKMVDHARRVLGKKL